MKDWTRRYFLWALGASGTGALMHGCAPRWPEIEVAHRPRDGGLDLTFFVVADTHFGYVSEYYNHQELLEWLVAALNALPGATYPEAIGGVVAKPEMVLVAGDLTEDGKDEEWSAFRDLFGLTGREGLLRHRVFETIGNHDEHAGSYVRRQIEQRHGDYRYALDYGDLRILNMGDGPDEHALEWLRFRLAEHGRERPVILSLHYPMVGPYSAGNWFGRGTHRLALLDAIAGFNIIAIFHGHFHATGHYNWFGHDVFNVGAAKHGSNSFGVVRVTDSTFTFNSFNWARERWWWSWQKTINQPSSALNQDPDFFKIYPIPSLRRAPAIPYPMKDT